MILDGLLLFDSAANITAATGTQASQNVIDLVNARDMGIGDNPAMEVWVQVATAFVGGTSLAAAFQGSTDNVTWTTYVTSPAVLTANLGVTGSYPLAITIPRPPPGVAMPRYLRLLYTTVGTFTPGAISAGIVLDRQDYVNYPPGIAIVN